MFCDVSRYDPILCDGFPLFHMSNEFVNSQLIEWSQLHACNTLYIIMCIVLCGACMYAVLSLSMCGC